MTIGTARPYRPGGLRPLRRGLVTIVALVLAGCASFSGDGGVGTVTAIVGERTGKTLEATDEASRRRAETRVAALIAQPLDADGAVEVALLNHPGVQAALHELGIAEADRVQAGRLPNPHFTMFRASRIEDGVRMFKIEQVLTFNLMSLVLLPEVGAIERQRFEQTQRAVALQVLRIASDARKAWYQAVAAGQTLAYRRQVAEAADTAAQLARRMREAGNFSTLREAREAGFSADAALGLARAERAHESARERLIRRLGLWGEAAAVRLAERLPDLPAQADDLPDIERSAFAERIDLAIVRHDADALARRLGLTRATRWIDVVEFGPARLLEGRRGDGYKRGYEVSLQLPLFDWGDAKVARAEAIWRRAIEHAAIAAIEARSEIREAYRGYRSTFDVARHYRDEIVPLRRRIGEENLLRYNGMLIDVFELLADARTQIGSVIGYIDALRDFWLATADLEMARIGRPDPVSLEGSGPIDANLGGRAGANE